MNKILLIDSWIDGLSALIVFLSGITFGLFFLIKGKKREAKLLKILGLINLFVGISFLGVTCDFFSVIISGKNYDNSYGQIALLSYIFVPWSYTIAMSFGNEIHIPKKQIKWIITSLYSILGLIFVIIILIDPFASFDFIYPKGYPINPESLVDYNVKFFSIAGIIMIFYSISLFLYLGIAILIKAFKFTGEIRKNFILVSMGFIGFGSFGLLEIIITPGIALIFIRIGFVSSFWIIYFGLKS